MISTFFFLLFLFLFYAYLASFSRLANGWPRARRYLRRSILTPALLAAKAMIKPSLVPGGARRFLYLSAPILAAVAQIAALMALPWHREGSPFLRDQAPLAPAFVLSGLSLLGAGLGGWASGREPVWRAASEMVLRGWLMLLAGALALAGPAALAETWDVFGLAAAQKAGWPFLVYQPLGLYVFTVSMLLSSIRAPQTDLRRWDWLGGDFHLQHGGSVSALYHFAEHVHVLLAGSLISLIYLGGWRGPWAEGTHWTLAKAIAVTGLLEWLRPPLLRRVAEEAPWSTYLLLAALNLGLTIGLSWLRG
ncbi:MAG: NADH-quinone oxidoreductase subunit H [Chloroflexi bacterium]|nr:NADH-quinone oxidoreductase subunit H [Chloroflexota bacterium]